MNSNNNNNNRKIYSKPKPPRRNLFIELSTIHGEISALKKMMEELRLVSIPELLKNNTETKAYVMALLTNKPNVVVNIPEQKEKEKDFSLFSNAFMNNQPKQ